MNILYICNEYPPGKAGGIGSATRNLAKELVRNGHAVYISGLYMPGYGQKDYEEIDGIKIWRRRLSIDIGLIRNNYSITDAVVKRFCTATGILSQSFRKAMHDFICFLHEIISEYKIDIIEWPDFNEYFQYVYEGIPYQKFSVPVVVKLHGTDSYIKKQTSQPFQPGVYASEKKHIHCANAVVAVSNHTAQQYASFYELDKAIIVLYNSITIQPIVAYANSEEAVIVFAGSLSKTKGLASLLRAWNIVHQKYTGAVLQIFGKGKPGKFISLLDKTARGSVIFKGFACATVLDDVFSRATAAVFPSYTECFSIVPMEAMANGCPVIFTERASGPELINDGVNGLLVDPDDPAKIAVAITRLLSDAQLRKSFSVNGRQTVAKNFNIIDSANAHLQLYKTVIENYNHGAI